MRFYLCLSILATSALLSAQVPEVLYLKFNEGGGAFTTADDSLLGFPGFNPTTTSTSWSWGPGKLGASCFSRQTQSNFFWYLGASIQVTGDWSIEFWIQRTSTSSSGYVMGDSSPGGFLLETDSNFVDDDDLYLTGSFGIVAIDKAVPLNAWRHVAIVNDTAEGTMTPFVDGVAGAPFLPTGSTDLMGSVGSFSVVGSSFWFGKVDELRIWNRVRTASEIQACMNTELSAFATDLTVSAIRAPVFPPQRAQLLSATETVTCEIMNVGTTTIPVGTSVQLSLTVNGQNPSIEMITLAQALAPGDQLLHTFLASADLSGTGIQALQVTATMSGDLNFGNDQRERSFGGDHGSLVNVLPWREDFESMPASFNRLWMSFWTQELEPGQVPTWNPDWVFDDRSPPVASGYWSGTGVVTVAPLIAMRSPLIDLRTIANPRLRFRLHSDRFLDPNATGPSHFSLDIVSQPVDVITNVFGPVGDLGAGWHDIQIDLGAYAGQVIQIRPRLDNLSAVTRGNMVYVDDFLLTDHPVGQGQAPQPGLAVFDLNDSMNIGMNVPSYGEAGPYYTGAQGGDAMIFSFEGAPLQPVLLAAGPLNPVAATFPNIGQLDIGGPIDPATGIPTNIFVLFDGNQPGPLNSFFLTDALGHSAFGFALPAFPPGPLTTFQAVLRDPATGNFVIGNAIELTVN